MFESDDFDEVLSQFEFSDVNVNKNVNKVVGFYEKPQNDPKEILGEKNPTPQAELTNGSNDICIKENISKSSNRLSHEIFKPPVINTPTPTKRKIIDKFFDKSIKRKFPGPAGILSSTIQKEDENSIDQIELLSQDLNFTENGLAQEIFDSPIWKRLKDDIENQGQNKIDLIRTIKQQAISGHLRRRKAGTILAFVEAVDRSVADPLIILRDTSGNIKCTLHRDAWSAFSTYIMSECCAIALRRPTILTTGIAFKKHYLNITISNILAIYSSVIVQDGERKPLPNSFTEEVNEFTMIKYNNINVNAEVDDSYLTPQDCTDLLDGIDYSVFSDEAFEL